MKKFMKAVLRVLFVALAFSPMVLGCIFGFVRCTFNAGQKNVEDFIRWL